MAPLANLPIDDLPRVRERIDARLMEEAPAPDAAERDPSQDDRQEPGTQRIELPPSPGHQPLVNEHPALAAPRPRTGPASSARRGRTDRLILSLPRPSPGILFTRLRLSAVRLRYLGKHPLPETPAWRPITMVAGLPATSGIGTPDIAGLSRRRAPAHHVGIYWRQGRSVLHPTTCWSSLAAGS